MCPVCHCFMFVMSFCHLSLLSCVDNYVVFMSCVSVSRFKCLYILCHCCLVLTIICVIAFLSCGSSFVFTVLYVCARCHFSSFYSLVNVNVVSRVCVHVMSFPYCYVCVMIVIAF